jgi:hypothetical protein
MPKEMIEQQVNNYAPQGKLHHLVMTIYSYTAIQDGKVSFTCVHYLEFQNLTLLEVFLNFCST